MTELDKGKIKFECQNSCKGRCCKPFQVGGAAFIFLTDADIYRLHIFLKQPIPSFTKSAQFSSTRFSKIPKHVWYMKMKEDGSCHFLKDGKCTAYEARPTQCRTFPFWPENMNKESWNALKTECPGIDQGENLNESDVSNILNGQKVADGKY